MNGQGPSNDIFKVAQSASAKPSQDDDAVRHITFPLSLHCHHHRVVRAGVGAVLIALCIATDHEEGRGGGYHCSLARKSATAT